MTKDTMELTLFARKGGARYVVWMQNSTLPSMKEVKFFLRLEGGVQPIFSTVIEAAHLFETLGDARAALGKMLLEAEENRARLQEQLKSAPEAISDSGIIAITIASVV